jgi:hypothetical protein
VDRQKAHLLEIPRHVGTRSGRADNSQTLAWLL